MVGGSSPSMDTMKKDNGGIKIDDISSEEERTWKYLQEQQHVNALKGASEMWVKGYMALPNFKFQCMRGRITRCS